MEGAPFRVTEHKCVHKEGGVQPLDLGIKARWLAQHFLGTNFLLAESYIVFENYVKSVLVM